MLSQAVEDYLKIIYKLQGEGAASTTDIARALSVSSASVTNMTRRLSGMGLAEYEPYRGVSLTAAGQRIALEIIRHHRLLETYLKEVLDYPLHKIHEEAEQLEHHISEDFEDKIEQVLGYPTHDPHGDPIPTRDGRIDKARLDQLADIDAGHVVLIKRISDDDPALLRKLEEVGLIPGVRVHVLDRESEIGRIRLRVDGKVRTVERDAASRVYVAAAT